MTTPAERRTTFVITHVEIDGHTLHQFERGEDASRWADYLVKTLGLIVEGVYDVPWTTDRDQSVWLDHLMGQAGTETFIARSAPVEVMQDGGTFFIQTPDPEEEPVIWESGVPVSDHDLPAAHQARRAFVAAHPGSTFIFI